MSHQPVSIAKNFGCHAWNADQSQVAVSPNNESILLFNTNGAPQEMKTWGKAIQKLDQHGGFVSAIDWHPETNLIVTSGHDRNAYVWKYGEEGEWKPTLVILRINRAATSVRWSPNGLKFGVTSGAKCVPVCHFEETNDWWISKMVKKHKSTVLCIAWCPNNKFIVTGSTDFKCRIFSAYIEGLDEGESDGFTWAKQNDFGSVLCEFDQAKAWVQGVSWSPDSMQVAFTGHGSTTHFVQLDTATAKDSTVQTIYSKTLPNLTIDFMTDDTVVGAGFDLNPQLFTKSGGEWSFTKKIDPEEEDTSAKKVQTNSSAARNKFKQMSAHGKQKDNKSVIKTYHKNTILGVKKLSETSFSTCGVDGRVLVWNL